MIALLGAGCGSDMAETGGGGGPDGGGTMGAGGPGRDGGGSGNGGSGTIPDSIERYIRGDEASRLVIELDYVEGYAPSSNVKSRIVDGFSDILDKPDGIEVSEDEAISSRGEDHGWSRDELFMLADQTLDLEVGDGVAKMHALFIDGHDGGNEDGTTLGLAWGHKHMALFARTMEQNCGGILPTLDQSFCDKAMVSVWTHEIGHTLGLVDKGLPMVMDHRDPDHGKHDVNDQCVMYWAYEGEGLFDVLQSRFTSGNETALDFDQACLDDIAAVRDR